MTAVSETGVGQLPEGISPAEAVADLRLAMISRAIDEREMTLQKQGRVFFQISGAGLEALGLGFARSLRPGYDWFFPYYRDLPIVIGLGVTAYDVLLQAVGSGADPSSGGRQMPSHWGSTARNIVSQTSATGSHLPSAAGSAEASLYLSCHPGLPGTSSHPDEITYASLGEGACSEGEVFEALSAAARMRLPLLTVVPDNGWAISVPARDQSPAPVSKVFSGLEGLRIMEVDGRDYFAVRKAAAEATSWIRTGNGPVLVHAHVTRPFSHSSQDTQSKYRPASELEEELRHDPIALLGTALVRAGVLTDDAVTEMRTQVVAEVAEAAQRALAAPRPDPLSVTDNLVAPLELVETAPAESNEGPVTIIDAINRTLHDLMAADERIRVFGEDVADAPHDHIDALEGKGGVFGITKGLQRRFGDDRCLNTPIAEAAIVGRGIGQALRGLRPCAEIQFFDYIWPAMQQIRSEAATARWRSNGAFSVPLVIRVPIGGYLTGGAIWHSQSGESIFAHIPGLLIAMPSRASDAAGLLRASFLQDDPVMFLEHKHLFRQPYARDPYPGPDHVVPFGKAAVRRTGDDLTIVTWGATVQKSLEAAGKLADAGVSAEVIDLRTIIPYDRETIAASVERTGRLLVVHEDTLTAGFGAEIAAWAADELFHHLVAPVRRVAALDVWVPYEPTLENVVLPQVDDIATAAASLF